MQPAIFEAGKHIKVLTALATTRLAEINTALRNARHAGILPPMRAIHIDTKKIELYQPMPSEILNRASSLLSQRQEDGSYRARIVLFGVEWEWSSDRPVTHQSTRRF